MGDAAEDGTGTGVEAGQSGGKLPLQAGVSDTPYEAALVALLRACRCPPSYAPRAASNVAPSVS